MYTLLADTKPNSCLNVEKKQDQESNDDPPSKSVLSNDDRESLDFTPTFIGEYRVSNLSFMKSKTTPLSNNFLAASTHDEFVKSSCGNIATKEDPLSPSNMTSYYIDSYVWKLFFLLY